MFFRYGLKNVTMDDIARELGISKKTLYTHFDKKKSIVQKVTESYLLCQSEEASEIAHSAKDPVHELLMVMDQISSVFESLDIRVVHDMQRYFPESWQLFNQHKEGFILKLIKENLKRGIEAGLFREEIDVDIIARLRMEQIITAMDPMIFPPDQFDIKEIHFQLLLQYVNGVSTENGRRLLDEYLLRDEK